VSKPGPLLLLTVDVEEDMPDWCVAEETTVTNAAGLRPLAEMCKGLGVRPTYLCTYPMASQPESSAVLSELARHGDCELGTHLHPWNTPPFRGVPERPSIQEQSTAYYCRELEVEVFREKLRCLQERLTEVAGQRPTSFRTGRFGVSGEVLRVLTEEGYEVDSSVTPLVHHEGDGGPDFRDAPQGPYFANGTNPSRPGFLPLVEVPVSIGLTRHVPKHLLRAYVRIPKATRVRGLLSHDYLGLLDFAWLYPPRFELELMQLVARTLVSEGNPVLNIFLHSSELVAGQSKWVRNAEELASCLERLRALLSFCVEELGARPVTLTESGRELGPRLRAGERWHSNGHV